MIKLDNKDRLILYFLIHNSRQSLKSLGKKIGISKESAHYRIKRLKKNEIIKNFTIFVNPRCFGYSQMMTHFKFTNISPNIKNEIIDYFVNSNYTYYVSLIEGLYDFQVDFLMGDPNKFESCLDEIREKYNKYLSFQSSKFYIRGEFYNYAFLLDNKNYKKEYFKWGWGAGLMDFDDLDFNILKELSNNSRIPTKDIAIKLNSTVSTINSRIRKFEKKFVSKIGKEGGYTIYTTNIDWAKIGYRWFHLQINMRDYSKRNMIVSYLRGNPYLIRSFKFLNIDIDLHFTFLLNNMEQLRSIIEDLSTKFPDVINDYHFYSTFKVYKHIFLVPELIKIKNPLNREI
jgi:Lrp/AsnC family transcriptional regulator for asnA, asnC and gidA